MKTHKDLDVWKHSIVLAKDVYATTKTYSKEETYGLADQMKRAAVSISSNIAEGAARSGNKEFIKFLYIAAGSATELDTQIKISKAIGLGDQKQLESLQGKLEQVTQMLFGLIRSINRKGTSK